MKNHDFKNFINDNSWELSEETIDKMMEKELEKQPEDIDMEFIDTCMNYLTGYKEVVSKRKREVFIERKYKKIKISRIVAIAIIIIISISTSMCVYAKIADVQLSDIFVKIFSNRVIIQYSDKDLLFKYSNNLVENSLYTELDQAGISNIMLPYDLYNTDYVLKDITQFGDNKTILINFANDTEVKLEEYANSNESRDLEIEGTFTASKKINIYDIDVYLFERRSGSEIETFVTYQIDKTQYLIIIKNNIEVAEKIISKNRY